MSRLKATFLHLLITSLLLAAVYVALTTLLYPGFFYRVEGVNRIFLVMALVALAIGPGLTVVVFKPGKPGLLSDMVVILVLQAGSLIYGIHLAYQERPVYLVNSGSVFNVVSASQIDQSTLRDQRLAVDLFSGPQQVYVTASEQERQEILWEALSGGKDLDLRPEYYHPLEPYLEEIRSRALPVTMAVLEPSQRQQVEAFLKARSAALDDFLYYHLKAREGFFLAVFSRTDFNLEAVLSVDLEQL